ncbi:P2Y purinoceptor 14-like [Alosa sapidissima]|uniref:P2Y purinoceptor 14-like n=1 Tax=Alosa sapidissima TaxID=34773 RepID=UPI001C082D5D|nr:P2Y purinoceptor 14-like [Alosa sapidissima]
MNASEYIDFSSAKEDCGINKDVVDKMLPVLFFLIFVPALVLNVTVMWILLQLRTKSTFMVYLKNLVTADLLMTLVLPARVASKLPGASLGLRAFTCRFASVLFYHSMCISIVLMGFIRLDRFIKVVRPEVCGSWLGQSLLFGRAVSAATWVTMLTAATQPTIILTSRAPSNMDMKTEVGRDFHKALVLVLNCQFWVVLVLIGFCYTCIARTVVRSYRSSGSTNEEVKRKTEAKVFIVLGVFLVCFVPYHIAQKHSCKTKVFIVLGVFLVCFVPYHIAQKHSCKRESLKVAKDFTLWLAATQICLDPLIHFFLCRSFREKLSNLGILRRFSTSASGTNEDSTNE